MPVVARLLLLPLGPIACLIKGAKQMQLLKQPVVHKLSATIRAPYGSITSVTHHGTWVKSNER